HAGIQDQRGPVSLAVEMLEQSAAQRRFARSHLAGEKNESLSLANPEQQVIECLAMGFAEKKQTRIGRDVERRLTKPKVIVVHDVHRSTEIRILDPWHHITHG